jgi:two-component system, NtrC family, nitrogen regulation response regulator NtrX
MPQMDGIEVLDQLLALYDTPVVMISGHGNIDTAVDAIKRGAYDYISKPLDLNRLLITIRNAMEKSTLVKKPKCLSAKLAKPMR